MNMWDGMMEDGCICYCMSARHNIIINEWTGIMRLELPQKTEKRKRRDSSALGDHTNGGGVQS